MKFSEEFKEALRHLPETEKDKLILRLLKKDITLANRLLFELVSTETLEERREKVKTNIIRQAKRTEDQFYSIGTLNLDVRFLSGMINDHVSTLRDKYGEIELNLAMINEVLSVNQKIMAKHKYNSSMKKFCVAVISRAFKILSLISKMHPDIWMEFEEEVVRLGKLIGQSDHLMQSAIYHGLDVNWLINYDFPENIDEIQKDLRKRGYLK